MAAVPKFRAQKVSKRVLESSGDVGVPRVQRCAHPVRRVQPLRHWQHGEAPPLRRRAVVDVGDVGVVGAGASKLQGAADADLQSVGAEGADAAADDAVQSPKFVTSQRASDAAAAHRAHRGLRTFKARPVPSSASKSSRAPVGAFAEPRPVTTPRPFACRASSATTWRRRPVSARLPRGGGGREGAQVLGAQGAEGGGVEARAVEGGAARRGEAVQPLDQRARRLLQGGGGAPRRPQLPRPPTLLVSSTPARLSVQRPRSLTPPLPLPLPPQEENRRQQKLEEQRKRAFVAKPARVLAKTAFVPAKSTKPLTEINGFQQGSDARAAKRAAWEAAQAEKAAEAARLAKEAADLKAAEEEAELKALRANMVHKPRDASVLKKKPFARARRRSARRSPSRRRSRPRCAPPSARERSGEGVESRRACVGVDGRGAPRMRGVTGNRGGGSGDRERAPTCEAIDERRSARARVGCGESD